MRLMLLKAKLVVAMEPAHRTGVHTLPNFSEPNVPFHC